MTEKDQGPYEAPKAEEIETDLPMATTPGATGQPDLAE
jgi:hypothetical protein